MKKRDKIGKRFGRIIIVSENPIRKNHQIVWNGICDCGNKVTVLGGNLRKYNTQSCGCLRRDRTAETNTKHGFCRPSRKGSIENKFHYKWASMRRRCRDPRARSFADYGGRGIKVCNKWNIFTNFRDDMFPSFIKSINENGIANTTLERKNCNGNYCPENCKWTTVARQAANKRTTRFIEHDGQIRHLADWARIFKLKPQRIHRRIKDLGWSVEEALTTPIK